MLSIHQVHKNSFALAIELLREADLPTEDLNHTSELFVIEEENNVIATIGIETYDNAGLLRSLAVDKNKRGLGIAREMVLFLENYAQEKGLTQIMLLTTTADKFFSKIGYQQINRNDVPEAIKSSTEFSSLCPSTAIVMRKHLM